MESKIIEIIVIVFIMFSVLATHELGHLLTGLAQGFRFELFVVGPLGIKREEGRVKVYFNKNLAYYGGVAAALPVDDNPNNIKKFANLILAGPIVSLVFAAISMLCVFLFNLPGEKFIVVFCAGSIGIFLATTIPSKTGSFFTDRKRYQRLMSEGKVRETEIALLRVTGVYGRDNSYKNVNINDIELIIEDDNYQYLGLFTKLSYQYENYGNFDENTKQQFKELTPKMPKSFVKAVEKELQKLTT